MSVNKTTVQAVTGEARSAREKAARRGRYLAVRWGLFAVCLVVVLLVLGGGFCWLRGFFFYDNPHFVFRELKFESTVHFTARQIQTRLEEWGEDGCTIGQTNLLRLDIARLRRRFLEEPLLESVEIRHVIPGTLDIRITERKAIAYVCTEQAITALIDGKGILFPCYDKKGLEENLPYITNVRNAATLPMGKPYEDQFLKAATTFIHQVNVRPSVDGAAYTPYVIRLNYERERLECMVKPLFANPVFPNGMQVYMPIDLDKMNQAFERLDIVIKECLKTGIAIRPDQFADMTMEHNVYIRE